jgi:hypothetical protein
MNNNELMVIATSAPTDRPGYRRDLLSCLCYPSGISVLFSYRIRWIEKNLINDHERLKNSRALIVFCDIPDDPAQNFRFLPLRYARFVCFEPEELLQSNDLDTHIAVRFTLNRYAYPTPVAKQQEWMLAQGDKFPRPRGHKDDKKSHLVLLTKDFQEGTQVSDAESWINLTKELAASKTLADCSFFRVADIKEQSYKSLKSVAIEDFRIYKARVFESGKSYGINMQFYLDPGKASPPKTLTPHISTESIKLTRPLIENIGQQTNATIIANCSRVYFREIATLVIEDPEDRNSHTARAEFIVILKPAKWVLPTVVVLLILGTFSSSISSDSIKEFAQEGSGLHSHAAGFEFVFKAVGSLLVGLGAYLGFRKIPSGE